MPDPTPAMAAGLSEYPLGFYIFTKLRVGYSMPKADMP